MRRFLDEHGLQQPDVVEYLDGSIALRWHEQKPEVVIDEIPEGEPSPVDEPSRPD
jgi:hypothetical protein